MGFKVSISKPTGVKKKKIHRCKARAPSSTLNLFISFIYNYYYTEEKKKHYTQWFGKNNRFVRQNQSLSSTGISSICIYF